jgi:hypothetical protein
MILVERHCAEALNTPKVRSSVTNINVKALDFMIFTLLVREKFAMFLLPKMVDTFFFWIKLRIAEIQSEHA